MFLLCTILILRILLSIVLWNHSGGFFWLTADDASRTASAYHWSQAPYFDIPPAWLPLGTWVHGIVLKFIDDPLLTSSVVNSGFSISSVILIYWITQSLFPGAPFAPPLAAIILAFSPLLVWLGLSGLSEPIFHFWMLIGILYWLSAIRHKQPRFYLYSSLGFLGTSMIRYEAWLLALIFSAFCILDYKRSAHKISILLSAALACLFIPICLFWQWHVYGDFFYPLWHIRDIKLNEQGLAKLIDAGDTSATGGVIQYLRVLWDISPFGVSLALVGIICSVRNNQKTGRYMSFIGVFILALVLMMRGIVATNFINRNLTSAFLLLIPYVAYGIHAVAMNLPLFRMGMYLVMLAYMTVGTVQSFGYSFQARDEVVEMALWCRRIIRAGVLFEGSKILLEARHGGPKEQDVIWDSLFLYAVSPSKILYDRIPKWTLTAEGWQMDELDNPSILDGQSGDVERRLRSRNVRIVIAYSKPVLGVLETAMKPVGQCKEYRIYIWPDDELIRRMRPPQTMKDRKECTPFLSKSDIQMQPLLQEGFEQPETAKREWENWREGFSITSRQRWEGTRALELRTKASGFRLLQHRRIEVSPGTLYLARVKVHAEQLLGPGVGIYMSTYRTAEDWKQLSAGHSIVAQGRGWQEVSVVFSPPEGAHFLLVGLGGEDIQGVAQFDGFELQRIETGEEKLRHPQAN